MFGANRELKRFEQYLEKMVRECKQQTDSDLCQSCGAPISDHICRYCGRLHSGKDGNFFNYVNVEDTYEDYIYCDCY